MPAIRSATMFAALHQMMPPVILLPFGNCVPCFLGRLAMASIRCLARSFDSCMTKNVVKG